MKRILFNYLLICYGAIAFSQSTDTVNLHMFLNSPYEDIEFTQSLINNIKQGNIQALYPESKETMPLDSFTKRLYLPDFSDVFSPDDEDSFCWCGDGDEVEEELQPEYYYSFENADLTKWVIESDKKGNQFLTVVFPDDHQENLLGIDIPIFSCSWKELKKIKEPYWHNIYDYTDSLTVAEALQNELFIKDLVQEEEVEQTLRTRKKKDGYQQFRFIESYDTEEQNWSFLGNSEVSIPEHLITLIRKGELRAYKYRNTTEQLTMEEVENELSYELEEFDVWDDNFDENWDFEDDFEVYRESYDLHELELTGNGLLTIHHDKSLNKNYQMISIILPSMHPDNMIGISKYLFSVKYHDFLNALTTYSSEWIDPLDSRNKLSYHELWENREVPVAGIYVDNDLGKNLVILDLNDYKSFKDYHKNNPFTDTTELKDWYFSSDHFWRSSVSSYSNYVRDLHFTIGKSLVNQTIFRSSSEQNRRFTSVNSIEATEEEVNSLLAYATKKEKSLFSDTIIYQYNKGITSQELFDYIIKEPTEINLFEDRFFTFSKGKMTRDSSRFILHVEGGEEGAVSIYFTEKVFKKSKVKSLVKSWKKDDLNYKSITVTDHIGNELILDESQKTLIGLGAYFWNPILDELQSRLSSQ